MNTFTPDSPLSVPIDRHALRLELTRRGMSAKDLADLAGVAPATMSNIRRTGRCSPRIIRRLALALSQSPTIDGIDGLVGGLGDDALAGAREGAA